MQLLRAATSTDMQLLRRTQHVATTESAGSRQTVICRSRTPAVAGKQTVAPERGADGAPSTAGGDAPPASKSPAAMRGHGDGGWKEAGWDMEARTLTGDFAGMLADYGQLVQSGYDHVEADRCRPGFGTCVHPETLISSLTADYPLAPGAPTPAPRAGTCKRYALPKAQHDLSPIIHALPGRGVPPPKPRRLGLLEALAGRVFASVSDVLVSMMDESNGHRLLFEPDPATGRGSVQRGSFMGYIAVSQPEQHSSGSNGSGGSDDGVDVAVVWRGTVFREEWESNLAQDELTCWDPSPSARAAALVFDGDDEVEAITGPYKVPAPWEVGVHAGFDDLYNRPIQQPNNTGVSSPRQVVREWLMRLMRDHNVATITTTGHSLGGGLAHLSGFGIAKMLEEWPQWKTTSWRTQTPPKVTVVSFASPRVGNYAFLEAFNALGVRALRVVNVNDMVCRVPGFLVQLLSSIVQAVPVLGRRAACDMNFWLAKGCARFYHAINCLMFLLLREPPRWAFVHHGQALYVDAAALGAEVAIPAGLSGAGTCHCLELYIRLVSELSDTPMHRNPLLLNRGGDILSDKQLPANWWGAPDKRGCQQVHGRWEFVRRPSEAAA